MGDLVDRDLTRRHGAAGVLAVPAFPVSDDFLLHIACLRRWLWLGAVRLAAVTAEIASGSTESKLGATDLRHL